MESSYVTLPCAIVGAQKETWFSVPHSGYGSGIYSDKQEVSPSLLREAGEKEDMKGKHGPHLGRPRTQE